MRNAPPSLKTHNTTNNRMNAIDFAVRLERKLLQMPHPRNESLALIGIAAGLHTAHDIAVNYGLTQGPITVALKRLSNKWLVLERHKDNEPWWVLTEEGKKQVALMLSFLPLKRTKTEE